MHKEFNMRMIIVKYRIFNVIKIILVILLILFLLEYINWKFASKSVAYGYSTETGSSQFAGLI
jgi:hypothetical protein